MNLGDTIHENLSIKRQYENLKMGAHKDLANFKAKYDRAVSNWITFKNTVMTDAELAWGFFERLNDSIYFEFKRDVNNSVNVSKSISA